VILEMHEDDRWKVKRRRWSRGVCPDCGVERSLRSDGTVFEHQLWIPVGEDRGANVWQTPRCTGGGKRPA
jgi:hypothetical protein